MDHMNPNVVAQLKLIGKEMEEIGKSMREALAQNPAQIKTPLIYGLQHHPENSIEFWGRSCWPLHCRIGGRCGTVPVL